MVVQIFAGTYALIVGPEIFHILLTIKGWKCKMSLMIGFADDRKAEKILNKGYYSDSDRLYVLVDGNK